jgi:hypothetical protein
MEAIKEKVGLGRRDDDREHAGSRRRGDGGRDRDDEDQ